jgi:hypothetical protein
LDYIIPEIGDVASNMEVEGEDGEDPETLGEEDERTSAIYVG